jgi:hypothetical protein
MRMRCAPARRPAALSLLVALALAPGGCGGGNAREGEVDLENLPSAGGDRVRVEVLNAGGRAGMARLATERLRDRRFDVVYFGNARAAVEASEVLDRTGGLDRARDVAEVLGIGRDRVHSEPDSTLYVDVTVRLGPDWGPAETSGVEADTTAPPPGV